MLLKILVLLYTILVDVRLGVCVNQRKSECVWLTIVLGSLVENAKCITIGDTGDEQDVLFGLS